MHQKWKPHATSWEKSEKIDIFEKVKKTLKIRTTTDKMHVNFLLIFKKCTVFLHFYFEDRKKISKNFIEKFRIFFEKFFPHIGR